MTYSSRQLNPTSSTSRKDTVANVAEQLSNTLLLEPIHSPIALHRVSQLFFPVEYTEREGTVHKMTTGRCGVCFFADKNFKKEARFYN